MNRPDCYQLINDLIRYILNAMIPPEDDEFRNEVEKLMGGHVISTPTTRLLDQGERIGRAEGKRLERLAGIKALMQNLSQTADQAMDLLNIPLQDRPALKAEL